MKYYQDGEDLDYIEYIEEIGQISELSRHLRTYFNYKRATIQVRFSMSPVTNICNDVSKDFLKVQDEIIFLFSQYKEILNRIRRKRSSIEDSISELINKIIIHPKGFEKEILKKIDNIQKNLWKMIHVLSELEVKEHPEFYTEWFKIASSKVF